jgi:hypothetical protein
MTISTKGFVLFKCQGAYDDLTRRAIAFSPLESELLEEKTKLEKSKSSFDDVKDQIELYRYAYESAWKFEICPKSKEDHAAVANAKNNKGYVSSLQSRKKEFTKNWLSNNPIPIEFKNFVKFNSTVYFELKIEKPNTDIWYEIDELEE